VLDKRNEILKVLQQDVAEPDFITALNNTSHHMLEDKETLDFGTYFKNHNAGVPEKKIRVHNSLIYIVRHRVFTRCTATQNRAL
jgi:hypothetical protein